MAKPELKIISRPAQVQTPYDEQRGIKRMRFLKTQLMAASVRYVTDGKDGCLADRLRTASDLSGIPKMLIEVEVAKR
jgi:hypothetical protein